MIVLALLFSAATTLSDVDAIVERHIEARGGRERIAALKTLVFRGVYREGDYVSPDASMALMRPNYKLVGDPDKPIGTFAEGYDGSSWEYYEDPGIVLRTVGEASAAARHRARFDHPLIHYRAHGATVVLEGRETIGGRDAYKLLFTHEDGFREHFFIDAETFLIIAERKTAPIHAFGEAVRTESRFKDYRPVEGVLFHFLDEEVEIATGKVLSTFTRTSITANKPYDPAVFSPPEFKRTPLQRWIETLFAQRDDPHAVLWSYRDFRLANPSLDTRNAAEVAGFQILKAGQIKTAIALLERNAADHPASSSSAFGVGRAYRTAGDTTKAREWFERAAKMDPPDKRAIEALRSR